jgi:hypothetical protein
MAGGVALFGSLFLTWMSGPGRHVTGALDRLGGFFVLSSPTTETAWQVDSVADIGLAGLALLLVAVAFLRSRTVHLIGLAAAFAGLVFATVALASPPEVGLPDAVA